VSQASAAANQENPEKEAVGKRHLPRHPERGAVSCQAAHDALVGSCPLPEGSLGFSCHSGMSLAGPERAQPEWKDKATPGSVGICGVSGIVVVPLPAWH